MPIKDSANLINVNLGSIDPFSGSTGSTSPVLDKYFADMTAQNRLAEQIASESQKTLNEQTSHQYSQFLTQKTQEFNLQKQLLQEQQRQKDVAKQEALEQSNRDRAYQLQVDKELQRKNELQDRLAKQDELINYNKKQKDLENLKKDLTVTLPTKVENLLNDFYKKSGFNQYSSDERQRLIPTATEGLGKWVQTLPLEFQPNAKNLIAKGFTKNINARISQEDDGNGLTPFLVKTAVAVGNLGVNTLDFGLGLAGQAANTVQEQTGVGKPIVNSIQKGQRFLQDTKAGAGATLDTTDYYKYANQKGKEITTSLLREYGVSKEGDLKDSQRLVYDVRKYLSVAASDPASKIAEAIPYLAIAIRTAATGTGKAVLGALTGADIFSTSTDNIKASTHEQLMANKDYRYALSMFNNDKEQAKQYIANNNALMSGVLGLVLQKADMVFGGVDKAAGEIGKSIFKKATTQEASKEVSKSVGASIIKPIAKNSIVKATGIASSGILKTAAVEGAQESVEQLTGNTLSQYQSANNSLIDGVGGSLVGGALQGGITKGAASSIDIANQVKQENNVKNSLQKIDTVVNSLASIPKENLQAQADSVLATNWFKNLNADERITFLKKVDDMYGYVPALANRQNDTANPAVQPLTPEIKNTVDNGYDIQAEIIKNAKPVTIDDLTNPNGSLNEDAFKDAVIKSDVDSVMSVAQQPSNNNDVNQIISRYYEKLDENNIAPDMQLRTEKYLRQTYGIEDTTNQPSYTLPKELEVNQSILEEQSKKYLKDSRDIKHLIKAKQDFEAKLVNETNTDIVDTVKITLDELNTDLNTRVNDLQVLRKEVESRTAKVDETKSLLDNYNKANVTKKQRTVLDSVKEEYEQRLISFKEALYNKIVNSILSNNFKPILDMDSKIRLLLDPETPENIKSKTIANLSSYSRFKYRGNIYKILQDQSTTYTKGMQAISEYYAAKFKDIHSGYITSNIKNNISPATIPERIDLSFKSKKAKDTTFIAELNKAFQDLPIRRKITEVVFKPDSYGNSNAKESTASKLIKKITNQPVKDPNKRDISRQVGFENIRAAKNTQKTLETGSTKDYRNDRRRSLKTISERLKAKRNTSQGVFSPQKTTTNGISTDVETVIDSYIEKEIEHIETTPLEAYEKPTARPEILKDSPELQNTSHELSKYLKAQQQVRKEKYNNTKANLDYLLALDEEIDNARDNTEFRLSQEVEKTIIRIGGEGVKNSEKVIAKVLERNRLKAEVSYQKAKEIIDLNTERADNLEVVIKDLEVANAALEEAIKNEDKKLSKEDIKSKKESLGANKENIKKTRAEVKTLRESIKANEPNIALLKQEIDGYKEQAHNTEIRNNNQQELEAPNTSASISTSATANIKQTKPNKNNKDNLFKRFQYTLKSLARGGITDIANILSKAGVAKTGTSDRSYILTNLLASKSDKTRALIGKLQEIIGDPLDSNIRSLLADLKAQPNNQDLTFSELSLDIGEIYSLKHIKETLNYYTNKKVDTENKIKELKDIGEAKQIEADILELDKLKKQLGRENLLAKQAGGKTQNEVDTELNAFTSKYNNLDVFNSLFDKISKGNKKLLDLRLKNNNITKSQYDLINTANYKYYTPFKTDVSINKAYTALSVESIKEYENDFQYPTRMARGLDALYTDQRTGAEEVGNAYTNLYISLENIGNSLVSQGIYDEIVNLYNKKYSALDAKGRDRALVEKIDLQSSKSVDQQLAKVANDLNIEPQNVVTVSVPKIEKDGNVTRDEFGKPVFDIYYLNHPTISTGFTRFENATANKSNIFADAVDKAGRFITVGRTVGSPAFTLVDTFKNIQTDFVNIFTKDLVDTNNNKIKPSVVAKNYLKSTKDILKAYPEFFKSFNNKAYKSSNELVKLFNQLVEDGYYTSFSDTIGVKDKNDIVKARDTKVSTILGRSITKKLQQDDKATDTGFYIDRKGKAFDTVRNVDAILALTIDKASDLYLNSYVEYGNMISKLASYKALLDAGVERQEAGAITRRLYDPQNTSIGNNQLARFLPFFRSAIAGADNTVQALTTKRGVMTVLGMTAINSALLVPIISAMFDDELGKFSILDLFKGIPFKEGESKTGGKTSFILPIGSGLPKLAWAFSLYPELIKHHHEKNVFEAYKDLILQESMALPNFSSQNTFFENLIVTLTPIFAKPIARGTLNKNAFGGQIYNDVKNVGEYNYQNGKSETPQAYKDMAEYLADISNKKIDLPPEMVRTLLQEYAVGALSYFYHEKEVYGDATGGTRVSKAEQLGAASTALGIGSVYTMAEQAKAEAFYSTKESTDTILKENKVDYAVAGVTEKFDERIKRIESKLSDEGAKERDIRIVVDYLTAKNKLDSLNRKITKTKNENLENMDDTGVQADIQKLYEERIAILEESGKQGLDNVKADE